METKEILEQVFNFVGLVKWPIVVICVSAIFNKSIKNLIDRITKIGYGDKSIEASQQSSSTNIEKSSISHIDRAISLFRPETIETFAKAVKEESEIENIKTDKDKIERLKNYSTIIYIMRLFESIYSMIYGSQIRLLEKLNTLQPQTRDSLKFFYDYARNTNPKFYENYAYDSYLNFLFANNLIRDDESVIKITTLGLDFLKYLVETNKDFNKYN